MKHLRTKTKWLLAVIGILFTLFILKIILFLTAKPKVTVDYVAEYNIITLPQNYDPNENSAPYYQKAFDVFVKMPDVFQSPYNNWPTDYLDFERTMLENRVTSNSQAFEYLKEAVNKPYYWIKRTTKETDDYLTKSYLGRIIISDDYQLRGLTEALGWDAKVKAVKGQFQLAFEDILTCYKAGNHKCNPNLLLMEQYCGIEIKRDAAKNAFVILDKSKVDNKSLKFLQDSLQQDFDRDTYMPGCQAEKFYQLDKLQRMFIDNGRGTGRLWWRIGFDIVIPLISKGDYYERKLKMSCFIGPTKKQVAEKIEQTATLFNQVMTKTPWQAKNGGHNYLKEIEDIYNRHLSLQILKIGFIDPVGIFYTFYKTRAQTEALIAISSILRFKTDKERLPESLEELVSTGYLKSIPMDPYSDGPLVYKLTEDNFKLYSVGEDFSDDGGSYESKATQESVYRWGYVVPHDSSSDIVYWPYKNLMRLRNERDIETEKIRKKTVRNLSILYRENAEPNKIIQLKEEWWRAIESEFAKYPKEYPDINKIRYYKEDWWVVIEEDAKKSLEKADQNQP
jgi:hypothetical protein